MTGNMILSPINANLINTAKTNNTKLKEEQKVQTQEKTDKKKLFCSIGAAIGVAALACVIIHNVRKGKGIDKAAQTMQNSSAETTQVAQEIKKLGFFDKNGLSAENIKLEKGKAINQDGSMFSGILKTQKNGKNIEIAYEDGFMTSSKIDDKIFKRYSPINSDIPRDKGAAIFTYDEKYTRIKENYHTYWENGKIKHALTDDYNSILVRDYSKDGKKLTEAKFGRNKYIPNSMEIYDEQGNIIRKIYKDENHIIEENYKNGILDTKKFGISMKYNTASNQGDTLYTQQLNDAKLSNATQIAKYKNGKFDKNYSSQNNGLGLFINNSEDAFGDYISVVRSPKKDVQKGIVFDPVNEITGFRLDMGNASDTFCPVTLTPKGISNLSNLPKEKILSALKEVEDAAKTDDVGSMLNDPNKFLEYVEEFKQRIEAGM